MIEFNPDGSIKIPGRLAQQKADQENKMSNTQCMRIRKEIVSTYPPKSCSLFLTLSDKITDDRFVQNIYSEFNNQCEVPSKLIKLSEKEFKVEIGTHFRRCHDCSLLILKYRAFLKTNIIEMDGGCTFSQNRQANFSYEDYFD